MNETEGASAKIKINELPPAEPQAPLTYAKAGLREIDFLFLNPEVCRSRGRGFDCGSTYGSCFDTALNRVVQYLRTVRCPHGVRNVEVVTLTTFV